MDYQIYDITVIGGGIIGLATAMELSIQYPNYKILVIEKEKTIAFHQTGHNSGVIHSGIYYKPGSLKARNCVAGSRALIDFCVENNVPYEICGKVIVATNEKELIALDSLYQRGLANGVSGLRIIDKQELLALEPHVSGLRALHSPFTGIVDYSAVSKAYLSQFISRGGEISVETLVIAITPTTDSLRITTNTGEISTKYLINCAGLYSDSIARMMGVNDGVKIIPFRGEYYMLSPDANNLVNGLIYPVPDPEFPFLGVHFTRTIHGEVEAGPNAVLAFAKEGYRKTDFNLSEALDILTYRGFWNMTARYWRRGSKEFYRSLSRSAFLKSLQRLVPDITDTMLASADSGVRAQEVTREGRLLDDFHITETQYAIHVRNAPSPGATASLAISKDIVDRAARCFGFS